MRFRRILLAALIAAIVGGAQVVYPLYPSPRSLCGVMEDRDKNEDRWASPHRGAVLILNGELYGLPLAGGHAYAFRERCKGFDFFVAIEKAPLSLTSIDTRNILRQLENPGWRTEERHAPFTIAARVSSEVQGCFSPPLVLTALAMQSRGVVRVEKRQHPLAP